MDILGYVIFLCIYMCVIILVKGENVMNYKGNEGDVGGVEKEWIRGNMMILYFK